MNHHPIVAIDKTPTVERHESSDDQILLRIWFSRLNSQHTIDAYNYAYRMFKTVIGDKPLHEVTVEDMLVFRDSLTGSTATRKARFDAISSLFKTAHETGRIQFNPAVPVRPKRQRKGDLVPKTLSREEILEMIRLDPDDRNKAIVITLYGAGLRVSELANLRWGDIQTGHSNPSFSGRISVVSGKGDKDRVVSVTRPVIDAIQRIRPEGVSDDSFVFRGHGTQPGKPMTNQGINHVLKKASKRIGRDVSAHWLRHSYATHALHNGAQIDMLARDLGHASVQTTGRYVHANPDDGAGRFLDTNTTT